MKVVSQKQAGGDGSINLQLETLVVGGLSVADVKTLIRDEVGPAFDEMSLRAAEVARARATEIGELTIERLAQQNAEALDAALDPDFQYALTTAQREYARSGSEDLRELLVGVLVDRASCAPGSLIQTLLNEALVVTPKLTAQQLAGLSAIFLTAKVHFTMTRSIEALAHRLRAGAEPLLPDLPRGRSWFEHLQYTGCIQAGGVSSVMNYGELQRKSYPGLFSKGLRHGEIEEISANVHAAEELLRPCANNPELMQIRAVDRAELDALAPRLGLSQTEVDFVAPFMERNLMSDAEAVSALTAFWPECEQIATWWNSLKGFTMTSVGTTVAHANWTRLTGDRAELSVWID